MSFGTEASGRRGMVVAGHPLAVDAGLRMLDMGGSSADALIASAAALCVMIPQAVTLGGEAFGLFYDASQASVLGLNASGRSPQNAAVARLTVEEREAGALASTVPALVRGWEAAHARFGRLEWSKLFEPAIALADKGVPTSRVLARALQSKLQLVTADPGLAALLVPEGHPLAAGDALRQLALAKTLRELAANGASAFYHGPIAESLVARLRRGGGLLDLCDLARCTTDWVEPVALPYRGYKAIAVPPNSFGVLALLQLQRIATNGVDLSRLRDSERIKQLVEAAEHAFSYAAPLISDVAAPAELAGELLDGRAPSPGTARSYHYPAGTAVTMAIDGEGNASVLVESIFTLFGSGVFDPVTGIIFNNRMRAFDDNPTSPNALAPNKRPAHTLSPMMLLQEGRPRILLGTPGALGQTVTLVQIITNYIDRAMAMEDSLAAPRWSYDLDNRVILEAGVSREADAALEAISVEAHRPTGDTPFFGSVKAVTVSSDGRLDGFADPRREGAAGGR